MERMLRERRGRNSREGVAERGALSTIVVEVASCDEAVSSVCPFATQHDNLLAAEGGGGIHLEDRVCHCMPTHLYELSTGEAALLEKLTLELDGLGLGDVPVAHCPGQDPVGVCLGARVW